MNWMKRVNRFGPNPDPEVQAELDAHYERLTTARRICALFGDLPSSLFTVNEVDVIQNYLGFRDLQDFVKKIYNRLLDQQPCYRLLRKYETGELFFSKQPFIPHNTEVVNLTTLGLK